MPRHRLQRKQMTHGSPQLRLQLRRQSCRAGGQMQLTLQQRLQLESALAAAVA